MTKLETLQANYIYMEDQRDLAQKALISLYDINGIDYHFDQTDTAHKANEFFEYVSNVFRRTSDLYHDEKINDFHRGKLAYAHNKRLQQVKTQAKHFKR